MRSISQNVPRVIVNISTRRPVLCVASVPTASSANRLILSQPFIVDDYTEGNAWQYTWLVPHDVHGLVKLFGNEQKFVTKLDSLFIVTGNMGDNASPRYFWSHRTVCPR